MRSIVRKPSEGVAVPLHRFKSLVLGIQSPDTDATSNIRTAEKETMKAIKYFVLPKVYQGIQNYKEMHKETEGEFATLQDVLNFVNEIERDPENRPTSEMSTRNKSIKIDLFYSDTNWSWHLGDEPSSFKSRRIQSR